MQDPVDPNAGAAQAGDQGGTPPPPPPPPPPAGDQGATPPPAAPTPPPAAPAPPQGGTPPPPPPPPAGGQPAAGQPAGAQPAGAQPPAGQKDLSGIMEEDVDISSLIQNAGNQQQQQDFISRVKIPPHPNTKFDEKSFVELLAGSISLTAGEKERIITAIPQLSQFQIDELIKIFQEEKGKFAELEKKHSDQIQQLEKEHAGSWQDLEAKKEEETAKEEEAKKEEEIKKNLGL